MFHKKIRNISILFIFIFSISLIFNAQAEQISPETKKKDFLKHNLKQNQESIEGEIIIKYKEGAVNLKNSVGRKKAESSEKAKGLKKMDEVSDLNLRLVKTSKNTKESIQDLLRDPAVEYAEPNFKRHPSAIPNDIEYPNQWSLPNIKATDAWDLETANQQDIIVAIIDTGVDFTHPDLVANMWNGNSCFNENNVAIQGGCPNHGWDFGNNTNNPFDTEGHGTFVAGLIGAQTNNAQGMSGMSFHGNIKIMAIKFDYTTFQAARAINFAKNNGARVINASYGGSTPSITEKNAITDFPGIFVASAGNGGNDSVGDNNDSSPTYPASYDNSNIISVSATNQSDTLTSFSNYGATSVDLSAPGYDILSSKLSSINLFSEIFDSASSPSLPSSFSDISGQWKNALWPDTTDKYVSPIGTYAPSMNSEIILSVPINTEFSESSYLNFYLAADIEKNSDCTADYLGIYTDNSDDNWSLQKKYCGFFSGETLSLDISSANSSQMRIKFLWHTNETNLPQNFTGSPFLPMIDDVVLKKFDLNNGAYQEHSSGTSFSTPLVAGSIAMIFSKKPELSSSQAKNFILSSTDSILALSGKSVSGGRLNLKKAMESANLFSTPLSSSIYRFWSDTKQGHFYTASESEKNHIIANYPENVWKYEGTGYSAFLEPAEGLAPVHRFWSDSKQHHFYTISETEKDSIIANDKSWTYESIAYYAYANEIPNTTAVYRFWSQQKQGHFFTASSSEKDGIIANDKSWAYEGIAWYVPTN